MAKRSDELLTKEAVEEEAMDSDDSSNDDDADEEMEEAQIKLLKEKMTENPHNYDGHVGLIALLQKAGELEQLREARQCMSQVFPLTPELWLSWIQDEIKAEETREAVYKLFDRAVQDYTSVDVWLEYFQYSVGDIGTEDGLTRIRGIAERALTAIGKHVAQGALIWAAYREVENAVLAGLQPAPGSICSAQLVEQREQQSKRIERLFIRQLAVPLLEMEVTWVEYEDWCDEIDHQIRNTYDRTVKQLNALIPYEERLMSADGNKLEEFKTYLKQEMKLNEDPSRVQCLFERALVHNCLVPEVWEHYGKYLDKLRSGAVILTVYERAVRNCPWHVTLWVRYCRALERHCSDQHENIVAVFEKALSGNNLNQSDDFLQMWTGYIDYMRRRVQFDTEDAKGLSELRLVFQRAIDVLHKAYDNDGDPNCSIQQYWARIEAKFCKNIEKARELWQSVMARGFGNQAQMWLEWLNLERAYGDVTNCRKLLSKAINSVTDWPEYIVDAFIMFEREEGTLDQLDQAMEKCDSQMKRIEERKVLAAGKEARFEERKKKQQKPNQMRQQKQFVSGGHLVEQKQHKPKPQKASPVKMDDDGFAVPALPSPVSPASAKSALKRGPPVYDRRQAANSKTVTKSEAPPPGYRGPPLDFLEPTEEAPPAKKQKVSVDNSASSEAAHSDTQDPAKNAKTVFISNLHFDKVEADLVAHLSQAGKVKDIRLAKGAKGRSRGFGYVEYADEFSAGEALKLDRTEIEGRPMFVSKCAEKKQDRHQFQYDTELEKKKLFVRGLPFSTNKDAIHTLFSQYGTVKEVRMVTYRSGQPKGIAYVEYESENDASTAVMKADGLTMGEHQINVSLSNPPKRRAPLEQRQTEKSFTPTLGSGKKDVNRTEKPRTLLTFQPRSLKAKAPVKAKVAIGTDEDANKDSASSELKSESKAGLSNAQFREMLLKKSTSAPSNEKSTSAPSNEKSTSAPSNDKT